MLFSSIFIYLNNWLRLWNTSQYIFNAIPKIVSFYSSLVSIWHTFSRSQCDPEHLTVTPEFEKPFGWYLEIVGENGNLSYVSIKETVSIPQ